MHVGIWKLVNAVEAHL